MPEVKRARRVRIDLIPRLAHYTHTRTSELHSLFPLTFHYKAHTRLSTLHRQYLDVLRRNLGFGRDNVVNAHGVLTRKFVLVHNHAYVVA